MHTESYYNQFGIYIVKELTDKLIGKFGYSKTESNAAKLIVFERIEITIPQTVFVRNLKDAKDLPILGTSLSGKCEVIITGDKQLQKMNYFKDIPIIAPHQFWSFEVDKSSRK